LNAEFFRARLDQAIRLRTILGLIPPPQPSPADGGRASAGAGGSMTTETSPINGRRTACRLVFSEGDGLSGLTVDRYDRWLVVQFTSLGMAQRREMWADLLMERLRPEGIVLRTERAIGRLEGLE